MKLYHLAKFLLAVTLVLGWSLAENPVHSATADSKPPEIQDVLVIEKKGRLMAFLSLKEAFSPKVFEVVHSGVTTKFTFEINLMRNRALIYDPAIKKQTLVHQVKYDTLKKSYTFISQNGTDEKTQKVTQSLGEMVDWMSEVNGHAVAQVRELDPDSKYYLQVRAKLNSVDFSFPFNYMLGFLDDYTSWVTSDAFNSSGM